jgi:hypothetical protein
MIITIPYGSRPGEKIVSEGFFACPFCYYKRPYVRKKVVKVNYFGLISIPSSKALMEYIHCGGCLNVFSVETVEPENQLKIKISEQPLPPNSLFDEWQFAYKNLKCEEILGNNPEFKILSFPLINTIVVQMQKAGVSIKLKMFDETKIHMYNILSLSNKWLEDNLRDNNRYSKSNPVADKKIKQFSAMAHYMLSQLP